MEAPSPHHWFFVAGMPTIYQRSNKAAGRGKVMTTGTAVQLIGKGYFSKAKSFPVLKQRREGKRRRDFEKRSDSKHPPTLPMSYTHTKLFLLSLSIWTDNNSESMLWFTCTSHTVNTQRCIVIFLSWDNKQIHIYAFVYATIYGNIHRILQ